MTPAIAALAAVLLLGSASAQEPGTPPPAPDKGATGATSAPVPGKVGIEISPTLQKKLLRGLLDAVAPPRPPAVPPAGTADPAGVPAEQPPVAVTPTAPAIVQPAPPPPRPASISSAQAVAPPPRPTPTPRPATAVAPKPRPTVVVAAPAPVSPEPAPVAVAPLAPTVAPKATAPAADVSAPRSAQASLPARTSLAGSAVSAPGWVLLVLLAAAAIGAGVAQSVRARRIARTREALTLSPRIDLSAGSASLGGLSLASPPVRIRARLGTPGAAGG